VLRNRGKRELGPRNSRLAPTGGASRSACSNSLPDSAYRPMATRRRNLRRCPSESFCRRPAISRAVLQRRYGQSSLHALYLAIFLPNADPFDFAVRVSSSRRTSTVCYVQVSRRNGHASHEACACRAWAGPDYQNC
jgi:hypothetical protein